MENGWVKKKIINDVIVNELFFTERAHLSRTLQPARTSSFFAIYRCWLSLCVPDQIGLFPFFARLVRERLMIRHSAPPLSPRTSRHAVITSSFFLVIFISTDGCMSARGPCTLFSVKYGTRYTQNNINFMFVSCFIIIIVIIVDARCHCRWHGICVPMSRSTCERNE